VLQACKARFDTKVEEIRTADETVTFKLPRILAEEKRP
ncbi:MAG: 4-hydroxy-3-methylbut-2-enyl diphosphate reductase, partial [Pseudomonadota bacterium]